MPSILARFVGLSPDPEPQLKRVIKLVTRCSKLSRREAHVLLLDYTGYNRREIREELKVSDETVTTYWKRIYAKTACHGRHEVRDWTKALLQRELGID